MSTNIKEGFNVIEAKDNGVKEYILVRPLFYFKTPHREFYEILFSSIEEMQEICGKKFLAKVVDCGAYISVRFRSMSDAKNCATFLNKKMAEKKDVLQPLLNYLRPLTKEEQSRNNILLETDNSDANNY